MGSEKALFLLSYKMEIPSKILEIIETQCKSENCVLIEAKARGAKSRIILELFIDSENGIEHENCKNISKGLDPYFESEEFFQNVINLSVSSPGAERPLKYHWQYNRNVGRHLVCEPIEGDNIEGSIISADEEKVTLEVKKKKVKNNVEVFYKDIKKAYIKVKL